MNIIRGQVSQRLCGGKLAPFSISFLVLAALAITLPVFASEVKEPLKEGAQSDTAPAAAKVQVLDLDQLNQLLKSTRGNVTVVNFWATWCAPCVAEMPELAEFHKKYQPKGVHFISLAVDQEKRVKPFVAKKKLPFPVYAVGGIPIEQLAQAVIKGWDGTLPTTLVLDPAGELQSLWAEQINLSQLTGAVDLLLKMGSSSKVTSHSSSSKE